MSRHRNWVFTINNYTDEEYKNLENVECKYIVYGKEKGEKEKTEHIQGYVELNLPVNLQKIKKIICERGHFELRRGTAEQASKYCKKDGDFIEKGEISKQGRRTDIESLVEDIKDGKNLREIIERNPEQFIKYNRGIEKMKNILVTPKKWREIKVIVFIGKTGVGKTKEAMQSESVYKLNEPNNRNLWFDNYAGEKRLVIDDFSGWINYRNLLTLLDGYPYRCEIKGGYIWAEWEEVYITSNEMIENWYKNYDLSPLKRRITEIRYFCGGSTEVIAQKLRGNTDTQPETESDLEQYID